MLCKSIVLLLELLLWLIFKVITAVKLKFYRLFNFMGRYFGVLIYADLQFGVSLELCFSLVEEVIR